MKDVLLFSRLFLWFSVRYLLMHRMRALAVIVGIALGAAVFTSVRLSVHASIESFSNSMDLITGRADLVLVRPGGRLPEGIMAAILKHPDVAGASAVLTTYVQPAPDSAEPFLLIGFDPVLDRSFRDWRLRHLKKSMTGQWVDLLAKPYTFIPTDKLAQKYGWKTGDEINLIHARQKARLRMLGVLEPRGLAMAEGGYLAITDIATFQEFTGTLGFVDRIDIRLTPAAATDIDFAGRRILAALPGGIRIELPSDTKESGRLMIRSYQLNLSILSFVSLFVGMFLVYSLVALNAATRRHELAVLRSTGASSKLLFLLFLAEGALFGMLGWIVAIPVSSFLVKYLLHGVSRTISTLFVQVHVEHLTLDVWELLLSFGVTVFISVLAALQPAREAMLVSPHEALTLSREQQTRQRTARKLAVVSILLVILVWPLSRLPAFAGLPLAGYAAILCLFVGFALLAPWGLQKLGGAFSPLLNRLAGIPAYLAGCYVRDSGTRTAVSVGALITAVALFTALVIMINSFRGTVALWVHQTVGGDLFVSAKMSALNRYHDPLPLSLVNGLRKLEAPVDIVPSRRFGLKYAKFVYDLDVIDLEAFARYGNFVWVAGDPLQVRPRLIRGEGVLVSEVFSSRTGLKPGDIFQTQIETTRLKLPVLGIVRDYRTHGGVVFYHLPAFNKRFFDPGWSGVRLFFRQRPDDPQTAIANLRQEVIDRCGSHLDMFNGADLRQAILRIFDETFAVTTVLLLIALIIAALGITITLAVQVLERSRQLNTLFAVGASFGQIRAMIFWEAALLIVAGEGAGLLCGFVLSYLLIYVINVQSFGWSFLYQIDWQALGMSLPLIITAALLAAVPAIKLIFKEPPAVLLRER
jgi:putative ABC transport system permease protein